MSEREINAWWQRAHKKEAVRYSSKPKSRKGGWVVPTEVQTLRPERIVRRKP